MGPSSFESSVPKNSMPSQVAEYMGSLRMRSRCLARAEQPVRSRQAHRIKVVTVVVVWWCIIASRGRDDYHAVMKLTHKTSAMTSSRMPFVKVIFCMIYS